MIRSLSNITDISVIDQNESNDISFFSKIDFDDNPIGSGGFASVYNVVSIDGIQKSGFVIKIISKEQHNQHNYESIKILHDKLKKRQQQTKTPIYHDLPELLGLPFLVFKAYDNILEKHCVAFLMYNLVSYDYEDFGGDTSIFDTLKEFTVENKMYLAYQLTKSIDFLHQIKFIHADISDNSLWLNSKRVQLAISDYDSGYHYDFQGKPTTVGKIGHWISSRFRNIIGQKKDTSDLTAFDRLHEEYWVLANALFEIVFGVMPFFFLTDADDNIKEAYLKEFEWPKIDYSSPLFNQTNKEIHQSIISVIGQFEEVGAKDLINAFRNVFNKGFKNVSKRLTSKEWKDLFSTLNLLLENNPIIKSFTSNKTEIKHKNEEVEFSFDLQRYNAIYLDNKLIPLNQESLNLSLYDDAVVTIKAINDFKITERKIEIKALKIEPIISTFEATKLVRDSEDPVYLSWDTENVAVLSISNNDKPLETRGSIGVKPEVKTTYTLTALGYFDQITTKNIEIDIIKPHIEYFNWAVNLNEGITNVDISWKVINATSVKISPHIKSSKTEDLEHVSISERTDFTLIAKGIFTEAESEITAHPFPVPIIKQIFAHSPKIEINTKINSSELNIPAELLTFDNIEFSNSVYFNKIEIEFTNLKSKLNLPKFENENLLIEKYSKKAVSVSDIYNSIIEKINKKINR